MPKVAFSKDPDTRAKIAQSIPKDANAVNVNATDLNVKFNSFIIILFLFLYTTNVRNLILPNVKLMLRNC